MWTKTQVLLLIAFSLFLSSEAVANSRKLIAIPTPEVDPALNDICNKTDYPKVCVTTIQPLLKGQKVDPVSALKAEIEAANVRFRKAKEFADSLIANATTSKDIKDSLSVCTEEYNMALDSLQTALNSLNGHDPSSLNTALSAADTDIQTCDEAFQEGPGVEGPGEPGLETPVSLMNSNLSKIMSNCFRIATHVPM